MKNILCCVIFLFILFSCKSEVESETELTLSKVSELIDNNQLNTALELLKSSKRELQSLAIDLYDKDKAIKEGMEVFEKFYSVEKEIKNFKDESFLYRKMGELSNEEFEQLKMNQLKKTYFKQETLNNNFIDLLRTIIEDRDSIINELENKKVREEQLKESMKELREEQQRNMRKGIYSFSLEDSSGNRGYLKAGNIDVWSLDISNETIKYTITGRVGSDPMCGITAKDNFGNVCSICIEKTSGDNVEVEIRYVNGTRTYTGYISR